MIKPQSEEHRGLSVIFEIIGLALLCIPLGPIGLLIWFFIPFGLLANCFTKSK